MSVELLVAEPAPVPESGPEALFEEARQRQRRRRRWVALVGGAGLLIGLAAYAFFAVGARSSDSGAAGSAGAPAALPRIQVVVVLVDVSGSMAASDIQPTRLGATEKAIRILLGRLSPKVEVGLVAFSTNAEVRLPPTVSRKAVLTAVASLRPEAGTALGDGIAQAVGTSDAALSRMGIHHRRGQLASALVVLVSDGAQNRGAALPALAAKEAAGAGIRIEGIALGTPHGTVSVPAGETTATVSVPPDPKVVRTVSALSHGEAFVATDSAMLDDAFRKIAATVNG